MPLRYRNVFDHLEHRYDIFRKLRLGIRMGTYYDSPFFRQSLLNPTERIGVFPDSYEAKELTFPEDKIRHMFETHFPVKMEEPFFSLSGASKYRVHPMQEWIEEQMDYMRRTQCTFQEGWEYCLRQMRKKAHLRRLEQAYQLSFAEEVGVNHDILKPIAEYTKKKEEDTFFEVLPFAKHFFDHLEKICDEKLAMREFLAESQLLENDLDLTDPQFCELFDQVIFHLHKNPRFTSPFLLNPQNVQEKAAARKIFEEAAQVLSLAMPLAYRIQYEPLTADDVERCLRESFKPLKAKISLKNLVDLKRLAFDPTLLSLEELRPYTVEDIRDFYYSNPKYQDVIPLEALYFGYAHSPYKKRSEQDWKDMEISAEDPLLKELSSISALGFGIPQAEVQMTEFGRKLLSPLGFGHSWQPSPDIKYQARRARALYLYRNRRTEYFESLAKIQTEGGPQHSSKLGPLDHGRAESREELLMNYVIAPHDFFDHTSFSSDITPQSSTTDFFPLLSQSIYDGKQDPLLEAFIDNPNDFRFLMCDTSERAIQSAVELEEEGEDFYDSSVELRTDDESDIVLKTNSQSFSSLPEAESVEVTNPTSQEFQREFDLITLDPSISLEYSKVIQTLYPSLHAQLSQNNPEEESEKALLQATQGLLRKESSFDNETMDLTTIFSSDGNFRSYNSSSFTYHVPAKANTTFVNSFRELYPCSFLSQDIDVEDPLLSELQEEDVVYLLKTGRLSLSDVRQESRVDSDESETENEALNFLDKFIENVGPNELKAAVMNHEDPLLKYLNDGVTEVPEEVYSNHLTTLEQIIQDVSQPRMDYQGLSLLNAMAHMNIPWESQRPSSLEEFLSARVEPVQNIYYPPDSSANDHIFHNEMFAQDEFGSDPNCELKLTDYESDHEPELSRAEQISAHFLKESIYPHDVDVHFELTHRLKYFEDRNIEPTIEALAGEFPVDFYRYQLGLPVESLQILNYDPSYSMPEPEQLNLLFPETPELVREPRSSESDLSSSGSGSGSSSSSSSSGDSGSSSSSSSSDSDSNSNSNSEDDYVNVGDNDNDSNSNSNSKPSNWIIRKDPFFQQSPEEFFDPIKRKNDFAKQILGALLDSPQCNELIKPEEEEAFVEFLCKEPFRSMFTLHMGSLGPLGKIFLPRDQWASFEPSSEESSPEELEEDDLDLGETLLQEQESSPDSSPENELSLKYMQYVRNMKNLSPSLSNIETEVGGQEDSTDQASDKSMIMPSKSSGPFVISEEEKTLFDINFLAEDEAILSDGEIYSRLDEIADQISQKSLVIPEIDFHDFRHFFEPQSDFPVSPADGKSNMVHKQSDSEEYDILFSDINQGGDESSIKTTNLSPTIIRDSGEMIETDQRSVIDSQEIELEMLRIKKLLFLMDEMEKDPEEGKANISLDFTDLSNAEIDAIDSGLVIEPEAKFDPSESASDEFSDADSGDRSKNFEALPMTESEEEEEDETPTSFSELCMDVRETVSKNLKEFQLDENERQQLKKFADKYNEIIERIQNFDFEKHRGLILPLLSHEKIFFSDEVSFFEKICALLTEPPPSTARFVQISSNIALSINSPQLAGSQFVKLGELLSFLKSTHYAEEESREFDKLCSSFRLVLSRALQSLDLPLITEPDDLFTLIQEITKSQKNTEPILSSFKILLQSPNEDSCYVFIESRILLQILRVIIKYPNLLSKGFNFEAERASLLEEATINDSLRDHHADIDLEVSHFDHPLLLDSRIEEFDFNSIVEGSFQKLEIDPDTGFFRIDSTAVKEISEDLIDPLKKCFDEYSYDAPADNDLPFKTLPDMSSDSEQELDHMMTFDDVFLAQNGIHPYMLQFESDMKDLFVNPLYPHSIPLARDQINYNDDQQDDENAEKNFDHTNIEHRYELFLQKRQQREKLRKETQVEPEDEGGISIPTQESEDLTQHTLELANFIHKTMRNDGISSPIASPDHPFFYLDSDNAVDFLQLDIVRSDPRFSALQRIENPTLYDLIGYSFDAEQAILGTKQLQEPLLASVSLNEVDQILDELRILRDPQLIAEAEQDAKQIISAAEMDAKSQPPIKNPLSFSEEISEKRAKHILRIVLRKTSSDYGDVPVYDEEDLAEVIETQKQLDLLKKKRDAEMESKKSSILRGQQLSPQLDPLQPL